MDESLPDIAKRVRQVLERRGVASQDIDDIVQEAFHRFEIYRRNNSVSNATGFMVRIAINIMIDSARRARRVQFAAEPVENHIIVDETPQPDEVYASRERLDRLNRGFAALDPTTRQMVRAQRMDGKSVAAIAAEHGVSVSAAEKRLSKGLSFLVDWMRE